MNVENESEKILYKAAIVSPGNKENTTISTKNT